MSLNPTDIQFQTERKCFLQEGKEFHYNIFYAGDIATDGQSVWCHGGSQWENTTKEVDHLGRPVQKHPIFKSKRRLEGLEWKAQTTWNTRKRKLDESKDLWSLWGSPPISRINPVKERGFDILKALLALSTPLSKIPVDDSNIIIPPNLPEYRNSPTLGHVIRDLVHPDNHNVFDFVNQYGDPDIEYPEFILNMLLSRENSEWQDTFRLYGALDIRESEAGLGSCHINAAPYSQQKESLVDSGGWSSTWTPAGAISHTHMDFYGSLQYFIHFHGKKLWLLWPSTPNNLDYFSAHHKERANNNRTLDCINHLEGLQVYYAENPEEVFILKPNTLHACVSFSMCGHTAIRVWNLEHFDDSRRMMEWGYNWIKASFYKSSGRSRFELMQEVEKVKDDAENWLTLIKRNSKHASAKGIKTTVKALLKRLSDLSSLLSVVPPNPTVS
ncbi:hypothetical protein HYPSUDRAFT_54897 [Hypholoma sublateritium FD-334 SS-4]|uniref:JmjC domain-containing protein n=1 Tax=Hypholoma sublateritium (strain FD-334 SS-4) TaxID=945553 RepID=A0A0D2P0U8_HYPSF|nr:hypothetical protein HYPSUDRAFT_54897 [Hypholoma sublateritium FD-334 SS-4]